MKKRFPSFAIIAVTVSMVLIGIALIPKLPVKLNSSRTLPVVYVNYSMTNASARVLESEVTSKLEAMLVRIKGVSKIESSSSSRDGGQITLSFDKNTDMDMARFEVSSSVRQLWSSMPENASYPTISARMAETSSKNKSPFLVYTINSPETPFEIQKRVEEDIKTKIASIQGVSMVSITGAMAMEWVLKYDNRQLKDLGISVSDIRNAVSSYTTSKAVGMGHQINLEGEMMYVRVAMVPQGKFDVSEMGKIPVKSVSGAVITLDKLVKVSHQESEPTSYFRINGLNTISMSIIADDTANQIQLGKELRAKMDELTKLLPQGYQVNLRRDATVYIEKELNKIYFRSGLTILILLLFVLLVSRSLKYTAMIVITMIANLAVAVIFYYMLGVEIHIISLAGLTISLGLIMDNTIVMADHLKHRGNFRVFLAILAATLTTISAVVVVLFLPEQIRVTLEDFSKVIMINLSISLFTALFLVPALMDKLKIEQGGEKNVFSHGKRVPSFFKKWKLRGKRPVVYFNRFFCAQIRFMYRFRWLFIILMILAFGLPVFKLPESIKGDTFWAKKYNATLGSPFYKEKIKPISDKVLGGTLRLFSEKVNTGFYSNNEREETKLSISGSMPTGTTLEQMNASAIKMESFLSTFPQIRQFQTNVYIGSAYITVLFTKEAELTSFPMQLYNEVVSKVTEMGGAQWSANCEGEYFSNRTHDSAGNNVVNFFGYNYDMLYKVAEQFKAKLLENQRINEVTIRDQQSWSKDDYSEYAFDINTRELVRQNINPYQMFSTLNSYLISSFMTNVDVGSGNVERVVLRPKQRETYDIWDLKNYAESTNDSTQFKLASFASVVKQQTPQSVRKIDQEYTLVLQYDYIGSSESNKNMLKKLIEEYQEVIPVGYKITNERESYYPFGSDNSGQYLVLGLIIVIIFFLCAILFNSMTQPFAVIMVIPISLIGLFLTYYLFEIKADNGTFASMMLLCGITVNASIYILNDYNNLIKTSTGSALQTYKKAFNSKIVSIMLTVVSTILGFVPFLIGVREPIWFTLAVGTIGGLVMSLVGIYFFLPMFMGIGKKSSMVKKEELLSVEKE
ncbi:MAG: efflux RND transporter permease subunit [Flavobacteriales bacterium]|nr:efflux RND transporter permease subunit [Flavobacteriales bacterium]